MIEVGYRYVFFGDDAKVVPAMLSIFNSQPKQQQIAAKDLGMVCYQDRNFIAASVPTQRRDIHLKKYFFPFILSHYLTRL